MSVKGKPVRIISAPSILGLRPSGVERLADSLLAAGLASAVEAEKAVVYMPVLNEQYDTQRDAATLCLNPLSISRFSFALGRMVADVVTEGVFALVLGGDCSILLGIMQGLKTLGRYGLVFMDAHADFYQPERSVTGEVADMDLAIVTGRGPEVLTNIDGGRPYVTDRHVIHLGQRDWDETRKYKSQDIRETAINCLDLQQIKAEGIDTVLRKVLRYMDEQDVSGFWIHFDTDVISDEENPAVDYRLPGGLSFAEVTQIIHALLSTGRIAGMSVSIFNPSLDPDGAIAAKLVHCLGLAFTDKDIRGNSSD